MCEENRANGTGKILRILKDEPIKVKAVASFSEEGINVVTSVVMEYSDGKRAAFSSRMILATDMDRHIDRFEIQGTKGSIKGTVFEFNGVGELGFTISLFTGKTEV